MGLFAMALAQTPFKAQDYLIQGRFSLDAQGYPLLGWPGNSISGRFQGSELTVLLSDAYADFNVEIDGLDYGVLNTQKGVERYTVSDGLDDGEHFFHLVRRTEGGATRFMGVQLAQGAKLLSPPRAPSRRIEFLGDSYTVGYGLEASGVRCGQTKVRATTNHALAYPSLVSRAFQADLHTVAVSGTGLLRNYGGKDNQRNFPFFASRAVTGRAQLWNLDAWQPQVVVIGLGINDFSTPVQPSENLGQGSQFGERWKQAYHDLLDQLRRSYGGVSFVIVGVPLVGNPQLEYARQVAEEQKAAGYEHVYFAPMPRPQGTGCQGHPSLEDHQKFAQALLQLIESKSLWQLHKEAYLGPVFTGVNLAQNLTPNPKGDL